jgi:hypothetical protein
MYSKKKTGAPKAPLPPCPRAEVINVVQYQLYDNGSNPGRGKSQHRMTIEVYCEGRLDLYKPYWKRTTSLLDPKTFMAWVDKTYKSGGMSAAQYQKYKDAADTAIEIMKGGGVEFAKLGHIGSNDGGKTYFVGQFVLAMKLDGAVLGVQMFMGDDMIETASFLYDQEWRPGGKRRKFFGFYDPAGYYAAMKAEREFAAKAEARGVDRRAARMSGEIDG